MIRGLYTGASGMRAQEHRLNALSNNLANVDLNGYKRDISVHKAFPELLIRRFEDDGVFRFPAGSVDVAPLVGKLGTGVEYNESYTVFEQGSLKVTENTFDLALDDAGFFVIDTPQGLRYTRNGSFWLGKEQILETKDGFPVFGEGGIIRISKDVVSIDKLGRIWEKDVGDDDAELVDTIRVVGFPRRRYLQKQGTSFWTDNENSGFARNLEGADRPGVLQGFLESSNVNPVTEMVNMIEVNRAYEANQKVVLTHDSLLNRLISQAARY
ncbi:Flagellar basal-body rod protein FlgF [Olavius algarvensis spirochete endosymbiont]|uniref:flagellar hook-basal body protein n=1 Tax=Olavius algarvensis spirochete endosymbiont TaxID=260710 RepID=UPI000F2DC93F|nr:flagellar hook-basal body protein [Olavius algarvensis spirochete endosymbiont]VDB00968.1 Flagellar basal-body rod protein FlgF [Olavius algarvensis spirochete endosymbiont]